MEKGEQSMMQGMDMSPPKVIGSKTNTSSTKEIDIAMKLGTNYPYGPFEWASLIGLNKIAKLLEILNLTDKRYAIAPALLLELAKQNTSNRK